jgi:hypothetical protein
MASVVLPTGDKNIMRRMPPFAACFLQAGDFRLAAAVMSPWHQWWLPPPSLRERSHESLAAIRGHDVRVMSILLL